MRDAIPALAQLDQHETVAVLDGAAGPAVLEGTAGVFAQRPLAVADAITKANTALGQAAYDAARRRGSAMDDDELEAFLSAELRTIRT
jgi:hypothetical protein